MKRRSSAKGDGPLKSPSPPSSPPLQRVPPPQSPASPSPSPSPPPSVKSPTAGKQLKDHYVFHQDNKASLLSTEAPAQNYRGLINLIMLILFVTHIRLIMENMLKYGILVNLTSTYVDWWATVPTITGYNVFIIAALVIERLVNDKKITEKQCAIAHVVNCIAVLAAPITLIEATDALPATGLVVLIVAIVLWMKLISYAYSNKEYRESTVKGDPYYEKIKEDTKPLKYPHNLTLTNLYGLQKDVWNWSSTWLLLFSLWNNILPLGPLQELDFARIIERLMKLSVPNVYIWLIGFYALFHLWLNICAEVLRFGDRNFYGPWWNSTTMDEYWRIWNIPTHNWLIKHIHVPLVRAGMSRLTAGICVFFVSAVFHELLVSVPVHTFRSWAFIGMMGNIPLIVLTRKLFHGSQIGNVIFWLSFCFLGQPLAIVLYYNDYANRYK